MKRRFGVRGLLIAVIMSNILFACSSDLSIPPVNVTADGVAIKGYDPVAYFTDGKPVRGLSEFNYRWEHSEWRFASSDHRKMFMEDTERYAPRYGGYCAYAVSQGKTADIDPEAWTILDGRLYLNLNKNVQGLWEKDKQVYIKKADENWPRMLHKGKQG